jgi:hypothetical protein
LIDSGAVESQFAVSSPSFSLEAYPEEAVQGVGTGCFGSGWFFRLFRLEAYCVWSVESGSLGRIRTTTILDDSGDFFRIDRGRHSYELRVRNEFSREKTSDY